VRRITRTVFAAWLLLACTGWAFAAESTFPDIQRILDNGKLLVAIRSKDAPPMIMTDDKGAVIGSEADLALDIGKKMGVAVEFIRTAETYDGVVDIVARKEADLAVSFLSSDVRRAKRVYFSQPYVKQGGKVFYNRASFAKLRRNLGIDTIEQLASTEAAETLVVGVLEGSIYAGLLERDMPELAVQEYGSLPEIMTAVKEGRIFAGLHGELQIEYYMRLHPETAIHVAVEPESRHPSDISIAVRPDAPNLLRWVNVYLADHVGLLDKSKLIERYLEPPTEAE
jgi:polar amino acid transport system substrate-binding protein